VSTLRAFAQPRVLVDTLLVVLFGGVAFLLACFELRDSDVWWHLRAGSWILEQGRVPDLDPFTFGSADQRWIDLHWLYQIVLFGVFSWGSVPGIVLLTAAVNAIALLLALATRPSTAPLWLVLLGWVPALAVAAFRFQPRPETFTLLFLAAYLLVLVRLDDYPRAAWVLPAIQLLWVNCHGLFVFGPLVLGLRLAGPLGRLAWRRLRGLPGPTDAERRWWRHVGGAALAVAAACLLNPYGIDGALFPLRLYPKVTRQGNPYKEYIEEFFSPRTAAARAAAADAAPTGSLWNSSSYRALYLLLQLVPLGFLLPALQRAGQSPSPPPASRLPTGPWLGVFAALLTPLCVRCLTLAGAGGPSWLAELGWQWPLILGVAAAGGALFFAVRRLWAAAALALVGGGALAAWAVWLDGYCSAGDAGASAAPLSSLLGSLGLALVGAAVVAPLLVQYGIRLFDLLLFGTFSYLALQSVNSLGRFGLVAGVLLGGNLAPWLGRLLGAVPVGRWGAWAGMAASLGVAGLLLAWAGSVVGGRYWERRYWERPFGLRELPFEFAHDAARFAGCEGMPRRALAFDLGQAGVQVFHNAPAQKSFMDPRLEVPTTETFQTYTALERMLVQDDPQWDGRVRALGSPVLLLGHKRCANAEATVLNHPDWRLVYFDATASVFLPRGPAALESRFPTLDLAARHFGRQALPPTEPRAAYREAVALFNMSIGLRRYPEAFWQLRVPALLSALARTGQALEEAPARADAWTLLGNGYWGLLPGCPQRQPLPAPGGAWDPFTGLGWAQATYCFRQAHQCDPRDPAALRALYDTFSARRLGDAQRAVGEELLAAGELLPRQQAELDQLRRLLGPVRPLSTPSPAELPGVLDRLLQSYRPKEAVQLTEQAATTGRLDWALTDRLAGACLHLGRPELARRLWQQAKDPPSEAVRSARLADTFWVERDFESALRQYRQARRLDPQLAGPCWSLAWLHTERGLAADALADCRAGLTLSLPDPLRQELQALEVLLLPYAQAATSRPQAPQGGR
jgi:tetratricopeptide (TPR) repeat protein